MVPGAFSLFLTFPPTVCRGILWKLKEAVQIKQLEKEEGGLILKIYTVVAFSSVRLPKITEPFSLNVVFGD